MTEKYRKNRMNQGKEYEQLAKTFNPVKFDAGAWTKIAWKTGMRYMVFTTKFHDGFSMYKK